MLELNEITKSFGGIKAVTNVSMYFTEGKITALIGPNGAGKTTIFNLISGFISPDNGNIQYKNIDITHLSPWDRAKLGIGRTFQDNRAFSNLTVLENVVLATKNSWFENPLNNIINYKKSKLEEEKIREIAKKHIEFVGLSEKIDTKAENLSYGQQKLLAFARLMMNDAELLLLDEPTAGINPYMINEILLLIKKLVKEHKKTVILIEHNLKVVLNIADFLYFLEEGEVKTFGTPSNVLSDPLIKESYTGL
ncbi:MAG: ABC transporter ATP-binding protein [Elusimicrobiales bacterium]|nr:ABC transporter ATP-binding protein [Elusimicrobiales bacterium]